jgi:Concanavalin A-like lectin/glucanases superfamily/F5/8 type C domain
MSRKLVHLITLVLVVGLVQTSLGDVIDPDLVGWWKFDEGAGTAAADSSGRGMHGVLVNDPLWRDDGLRKGCLFFDGDDAYVQVAHQDILNPSDGSFTVTFWASVEVTPGTSGDTTWDLPVAKRDSGSVGYYVGASRGQGSGDQTGYRFMLGDTAANRTDTPFLPVPLDEWVFVTAVLDRAQNAQKISVDGGQTWATTTPPPGPIAPAQDLGIGWDIGQNNYWHHGRIDDVILFSVALSDDQIELLMQGGLTPELAMAPSPRDGGVDVPTHAVLSWAPGLYASTHDVYFGTTFADVNAADRANPLDVLLSQGQGAPAYDPGRLAFGQTYYWRVDEVSAAPDNTIFKGDVWSFTAEPFAYPIENIIATSNAEPTEGSGPERAVDGSGLNADDQHSVVSSDMWAGMATGAEPVYIQFEFDRVYKLHQLLVWNYNVEFELMLGFGFKEVTVEHSEDGVDWTILKEVQFAQATARADYTANTSVDFEGVAAKYLRLTATSGWGLMGQFGLSEVRVLTVPVQARQPEPADGAADVSIDTMLDWRTGREAVAHDVYFGTDAGALALVDTVADSQYDPGSLDLGMTYYWQIDEVNEAKAISTWEGTTWSFSTQEYIVVDDFESYTDDEGGLIYETWIDGWENETGSQVGYLEAPFAEQTIVHGGRQSMPLTYDNSVPLSRSEAERFFAMPQDWTLYGAGTLTLHFQGAVGNSGQLYVKINDVKVAYNGDAADIASTVWQPWNIDLSAVGGNLASVTTLTIGIEGAAAQGILYIDDVRLSP